MKKLNALALGYAGATILAIIMLLFGMLGNLGLYEHIGQTMQQWHIFLSISTGGIIGGMIEVIIGSFIFFYIFAVIYNVFTIKK